MTVNRKIEVLILKEIDEIFHLDASGCFNVVPKKSEEDSVLSVDTTEVN